MSAHRWLQILSLISCFLISNRAAAQFQQLAKRVPGSANALVMFDVGKIQASPIAIQKQWQGAHTKAFVDGLVTMPPDTERFVLASQLDYEFMRSIWDVALLDLKQPRLLPDVARKLGGQLDDVGGVEGVALPSDAYVVRFNDKSYGAMAPANRQNVGRWIRETQENSQPQLSSYLTAAIGYVDQVGTPVIIAFDLQDVLTPASITQRLQDSATLKGQKVDLASVANSLKGIRGLTLGVTFNKEVYGKIKIDFEGDVSALGSVAKPLLLEVLANHGATIEDFETWTSEVKGNQLTLGGNLSDSGMRRLFSLVDAPLSFVHATAESSDQNQAVSAAEASQQYFHSIASLLDDLQDKKGTATHLNMYGVWFEKYAVKVSQLPMLNVDPELLNYGAYIESQLRNASLSVKAKGMRTRARTVNANANQYNTDGTGYRYGRYGDYGAVQYGLYNSGNPGAILNNDLRQQQSAATQIQTQETVNMAATATTIMADVKAATSSIRRTMTQKFQIEF